MRVTKAEVELWKAVSEKNRGKLSPGPEKARRVIVRLSTAYLELLKEGDELREIILDRDITTESHVDRIEALEAENAALKAENARFTAYPGPGHCES